MPDEHARYADLVAQLDATDSITPNFASRFALQAAGESDATMGESAVIALITHRGVDASVLDTVEQVLPSTWESAREHLQERRVRLPLERGELDEEHILVAADFGSRRLQLWLLDEIALPEAALRTLATKGATTAIRNRAQQQLS
jgi:hypothetical protein